MGSAPQQGHTFDTRWYSMISGGGGGRTSTTWRRCRPCSLAPPNEASQRPQRSGWMTIVLSGSSTRLREAEGAPGCLPGLRPDLLRDERFFAGFFSHSASDDGGREEFDESADRRRSSSQIRSDSSATTRFSSAFSTASSS